MNGPLDCPFCKQRPTHWFVEEGQPYVVCDNHSEPIKMRLSDWNVRSSLVGDKRRPGSVDTAPLAQSVEPPTCIKCDGEGFINRHANLPDEPCPHCSGASKESDTDFLHRQDHLEAQGAMEALELENKRLRTDRDYQADLAIRWKAQFDSAAAAASEYSEFWEKHSGDFDQFGNYVPYSQMDGDLRAAKAEIDRLRTSLQNILEARDDNQPAALNMPDVEYARSIIRIIHREARRALQGTSTVSSNKREC